MNRRLDPVQVLDEGNDPALVEELVLLVVALVLDEDAQAAVQERQLAEPLGQHVEAEVDGLEHGGVRLECDARPSFGGGARFLERRQGFATLVGLLVHLAVALDLDLEVLRQRIDDGQADAVQAAGDLVGALVELAAGVQLGEHDLGSRQLLGGVDVNGNAAAVVDHGDAVVDVDGDLDAVALAGERLVDGVVDDLVDEVMETSLGGVSDVHAGALPDSFQPLENLDLVGLVVGPGRSSHYVKVVSGRVDVGGS